MKGEIPVIDQDTPVRRITIRSHSLMLETTRTGISVD
jgi:hypothetical protein